MITDLFNNFLRELNKKTAIEVKYKDQSLLMKIIGYILFFNPDFMLHYTTTIGNTVYFPSSDFIIARYLGCVEILSHEYIHIRDSQKISKLLFSLSYLLPQLLFPIIFLLGFIWTPLFYISFFFLLPLPAPFRKNYELRGYRMSLFTENEILKYMQKSEEDRKATLTEHACKINDKYVKGSGYYYMWIFGGKEYLDKAVNDIISGDILREECFEDIRSSLDEAFKSV